MRDIRDIKKITIGDLFEHQQIYQGQTILLDIHEYAELESRLIRKIIDINAKNRLFILVPDKSIPFATLDEEELIGKINIFHSASDIQKVISGELPCKEEPFGEVTKIELSGTLKEPGLAKKFCDKILQTAADKPIYLNLTTCLYWEKAFAKQLISLKEKRDIFLLKKNGNSKNLFPFFHLPDRLFFQNENDIPQIRKCKITYELQQNLGFIFINGKLIQDNEQLFEIRRAFQFFIKNNVIEVCLDITDMGTLDEQTQKDFEALVLEHQSNFEKMILVAMLPRSDRIAQQLYKNNLILVPQLDYVQQICFETIDYQFNLRELPEKREVKVEIQGIPNNEDDLKRDLLQLITRNSEQEKLIFFSFFNVPYLPTILVKAILELAETNRRYIIAIIGREYYYQLFRLIAPNICNHLNFYTSEPQAYQKHKKKLAIISANGQLLQDELESIILNMGAIESQIKIDITCYRPHQFSQQIKDEF